MDFHEITYDGQPPIDAYGTGYFRINGDIHEGAMMILPNSINQWEGYDNWEKIIKAKPEFDVLFIGTGMDISPLPKSAQTMLEQADISYDLMSTPAACRTYNVLLSEGRRIALAVLPV